jgi:hypothetical protein
MSYFDAVLDNALILSAKFGFGSLFPLMLHVKYIHGEQEFGVPFDLNFVGGLLKVAGAADWRELPNKYIRVKHDGETIYEIWNIIGDEWVTVCEDN